MKKFTFSVGTKVSIEIEAENIRKAWGKLSLILNYQSFVNTDLQEES